MTSADSTPLYFPAHTWDELDPWVQARISGHCHYSLYGWIPSLPLGIHVGWIINGRQVGRDRCLEHHGLGGHSWTGGAPVGLIPHPFE